MRRTLLILAGLVSLATAAAAQDGARFSLGYAYLKSLEEGGGSAPLGFYVSFAGSGKTTLELDGAYHRDKDGDFKQEFYTVTAGPRFSPSSRGSAAWAGPAGTTTRSATVRCTWSRCPSATST